MKSELSSDRHGQLRRELTSNNLNPRQQCLDLRPQRRVNPLLDGRLSAQSGETGGELNERADRNGDVAGLFGGRRAEKEEEDAREGFDALEGKQWGGGLVRVEGKGRESEGGEGVVEENVYEAEGKFSIAKQGERKEINAPSEKIPFVATVVS